MSFATEHSYWGKTHVTWKNVMIGHVGCFCFGCEEELLKLHTSPSTLRAAIEHCFTSQADKENMGQLWDTWLAEHDNMI